MLGRRHNGVFLDMRLGKTLLTCRYLEQIGAKRTLVVSPLSVAMAWEDETKMEGLGFVPVAGTKKERLARAMCRSRRKTTLWSISYESLRETPDIALAMDWDAVVLDESTKIKNPSAKIAKLCRIGFRDVPNRILLSGLPAPESQLDYFSQMVFMLGSFMGERNYWRWRERYFQADSFGFSWAPRPGASKAIAKALAQYCTFMTRKQAGLGKEMIFQTRHYEMARKQKEAYERARDYFEWQDHNGEVRRTNNAATRFIWMQRISGGFSPDGLFHHWKSKLKDLNHLLDTELRNEKVVVWAHFNAELDAMIQSRKSGAALIRGSTPKHKRDRLTREFSTGKDLRVLFIQEACGQFGINLSAADTAIYYSNAFSLEQRNQSMQRIVDIASKEAPLTIDLVTAGSADQVALDALQAKNTSVTYQRLLINRQKDQL